MYPKNPQLEHLHFLKTPEEFNNMYESWGEGAFQTKITLGDYICSDLAKRYLSFFSYYKHCFREHPLLHEDVTSTLKEISQENKSAKDCHCLKCTQALPPIYLKLFRNN
jgi:hypothetical protein